MQLFIKTVCQLELGNLMFSYIRPCITIDCEIIPSNTFALKLTSFHMTDRHYCSKHVHKIMFAELTRWLYCAKRTQYSIRLEAVRYMQQVFPCTLDANGILIASAVFAGDRPTDRMTDHTTRSVTIGGMLLSVFNSVCFSSMSIARQLQRHMWFSQYCYVFEN